MNSIIRFTIIVFAFAITPLVLVIIFWAATLGSIDVVATSHNTIFGAVVMLTIAIGVLIGCLDASGHFEEN